ncbi:MAG: diaminopimelate decarboxylase family protein [Candidatus Limnocylindrales bacterium]
MSLAVAGAAIRSAGLVLDPGSFDLEALARAHDTPFYLYDLAVVEDRVSALRAALPDPFHLAYAVKANPHRAMLGRMANLGLGADIASGGELARVIAAGVDLDRVVFTGPGKRDAELASAVAAGVGLITVESSGELRRLASIAATAGRRVSILLRRSLDPMDALVAETTPIIGDGGAGKFGMDDDDLRASATFAIDSPWLELRGIHAFGASNVLDAPAVIRHVEQTMAVGRRLAMELGFALRTVDIGGGLGIPYADAEAPLDLQALGDGLDRLVWAWATDPVTTDTEVLIEPGRFLVGPAGVYVTRVVDTKRVRGRAIAIVDGGINHLIRPVLVGQSQRIRRVGAFAADGAAAGMEQVTIGGPLCTGLDILARDIAIGMPEVGELLAVLDTGAYGYTESMPLFLSRPLPAEVIV